jgi:hypothetical protein
MTDRIDYARAAIRAREIVEAHAALRVRSDNLDLAEGFQVLRAVNADLLAALRLHKAWSDSERAGPDYGGQTRDTHPDGERIWNAWWNNQIDLCDRANTATDAAITRATES